VAAVAAVPATAGAAARDVDPVVLKGSALGAWAAPANVTAKLPLTDLKDCQTFGDGCAHNHYADPELDTQRIAPQQGVATDRLLGYRWDGSQFVQIPFQVDEVFTRYLDNSASGFAVYSGEDQHTTYAYDREGFRYTRSDPDNPCLARPDSPAATDPVPGLDGNDEVAFMASDAGSRAPAGTPLPAGIQAAKVVTVTDPLAPTSPPSYVYVMLAAPGGPTPEYDASNGYVHYARDPNADVFHLSQSNYENYGNAAVGPYCDANGNPVLNADDTPAIGRRRPGDEATVTTPRYRFRYDGRWLMTGIEISADGGRTYGPNVVDRWKARAFAQDPGSKTPCCGFEEEDTNWGGSSTLLGERVGPVRAIRETWGADSGTNVVRRETFYRDGVEMKTWLRVHPIPPLDGIYAQWDFRAGRMTRFYTPSKPDGVAIDGRNDEVFGNLDDPCNEHYDANDTGALDQTYRSIYRAAKLCDVLPYHQSVDLPDPTLSGLNAALNWTQTSGPWGTIVDRWSVDVPDVTPGGLLQSLVAVPYYRDDSCFDDGTGSDPGPKVKLRSGDEPRTTSTGDPRRCWHPEDGIPDGSDRFFQGSIGTHGLHLLFLVDSDNARLTVPVDEIVAKQRMVMLPGDPGNVGERYGRDFERPLVPVVADFRG
jgi:hypothetical protein